MEKEEGGVFVAQLGAVEVVGFAGFDLYALAAGSAVGVEGEPGEVAGIVALVGEGEGGRCGERFVESDLRFAHSGNAGGGEAVFVGGGLVEEVEAEKAAAFCLVHRVLEGHCVDGYSGCYLGSDSGCGGLGAVGFQAKRCGKCERGVFVWFSASPNGKQECKISFEVKWVLWVRRLERRGRW